MEIIYKNFKTSLNHMITMNINRQLKDSILDRFRYQRTMLPTQRLDPLQQFLQRPRPMLINSNLRKVLGNNEQNPIELTESSQTD